MRKVSRANRGAARKHAQSFRLMVLRHFADTLEAKSVTKSVTTSVTKSCRIRGNRQLKGAETRPKLCDGFDMILQDYSMPELEEGEWLLWRCMGAYTTCAGSTFNGFQKPITWYLLVRTCKFRGQVTLHP